MKSRKGVGQFMTYGLPFQKKKIKKLIAKFLGMYTDFFMRKVLITYAV
jgi:hypothetical protein